VDEGAADCLIRVSATGAGRDSLLQSLRPAYRRARGPESVFSVLTSHTATLCCARSTMSAGRARARRINHVVDMLDRGKTILRQSREASDWVGWDYGWRTGTPTAAAAAASRA
jgi:hypothetical protein